MALRKNVILRSPRSGRLEGRTLLIHRITSGRGPLRWLRVALGTRPRLCLRFGFGRRALCDGRPRWFRGYYYFSSRLGFQVTQCIGRIVLIIIFKKT
jgi:hypothetical protein